CSFLCRDGTRALRTLSSTRWPPSPASRSLLSSIGWCGRTSPRRIKQGSLRKIHAARSAAGIFFKAATLLQVLKQEVLKQARAARPFVFGGEHLDRNFGRIGVGRDAVLIEIFGGLLDLDVAGQRSHDRLDEAFRLHLLLHLNHV